MAEFLYREEGYKIIGCFYTVYNSLGNGFLESVYTEALSKEFEKNEVPYIREEKIDVFYQNKKLKKYFKADFVCFDKIIVELKATPFIHKNDINRILNYLKTTGLKLGILVNFGEKSLTYKRVINM